MSSNSISPNQREILSAQSTITGKQEYLTSTSGKLNTTASVTISGTALPIAGATTAIVTAIVDGSGNQITAFGTPTEYTDGGVPPVHPVGGTIEWSDGANWQTVSTAKPLPVSASVTPAAGVVDANNSTTSTLLAGATFTGTFTSVLGYSVVEVVVYSDQASATSGMLIEFSTDHVNWDDSSTFTFTPGSAGPNQGNAFVAGVRGQYMRVVYTNGGTNQTTFRLQTVLKPTTVGGDILAIGSTITAANHAQLTSSQIYGVTTAGGGSYVPVKVNPSGALTAAVTAADGDVFVRSNAAATFPVNAVQSGTWNITNISGTVSLPTGAATAAKQPAIGTAGTASADVITVQGIASMTAIKTDGSATTQPVSGTVTANAGTNLNTSLLALESGGNLATIAGTIAASKVNVNISSGSIANTSFAATQATAASLNATVVGTGTFAVQNTPVAPATIFNGKTTVTTAGTRVTLAASQAIQSVTIKALSSNTGAIYVGNNLVASTNGFQLAAGDTVSMDVANLNTVNIDSAVNGEGVTYVAIG